MQKKENYQALLSAFSGLCEGTTHRLSLLANTTAIIKEHFPHFSWVGFYLMEEGMLHLGPFQGKVACTEIRDGHGVCGTSSHTRQTIIVPNVHHFPGHIACDALSLSEIVVPLLEGDQVIGVLDIDAYEEAVFDDVDAFYLEKLVEILMHHLRACH